MSKPNDGGPALPVAAGSKYYDREGEGAILLDGYPGMSLRQYYVGQLITGAIEYDPKALALHAVLLADALIAELEKGSE